MEWISTYQLANFKSSHKVKSITDDVLIDLGCGQWTSFRLLVEFTQFMRMTLVPSYLIMLAQIVLENMVHATEEN